MEQKSKFEVRDSEGLNSRIYIRRRVTGLFSHIRINLFRLIISLNCKSGSVALLLSPLFCKHNTALTLLLEAVENTFSRLKRNYLK